MFERALHDRRRSDLDCQSVPGTKVGASRATPASIFVNGDQVVFDGYRPEPAEGLVYAGTTSFAPIPAY